jgi:uncharacterized protein (DUF1501 family)
MFMKIKSVWCAILLCLTATLAVGQTVSVNYNHSQSFAAYHTYAWGSNNANQVKDSILAQAAMQDVDAALQAKGLQKVDESKTPDLLVTVSGGMKEQTSYTAMGMRGFGGGMGMISPEQNVVGTMIIDLFDAKSQSLVWRGIGQNTLSNNGSKNQDTVQKAVAKMFKQWPK